MPDITDEADLRQQLVEGYQRVEAIGLNELSSGNLSVRFGDGMLISPNGARADTISVDAVVDTSFDGRWRGDSRPSSEWRMHAAIYERNADAQAVVHTHSDYCVAVASHFTSLPGFHYLVGVFGGDDVPCVRYSTFGTQRLAGRRGGGARRSNRLSARQPRHGLPWADPEACRQPGPSPGDHVSAVRPRPAVG